MHDYENFGDTSQGFNVVYRTDLSRLRSKSWPRIFPFGVAPNPDPAEVPKGPTPPLPPFPDIRVVLEACEAEANLNVMEEAEEETEDEDAICFVAESGPSPLRPPPHSPSLDPPLQTLAYSFDYGTPDFIDDF